MVGGIIRRPPPVLAAIPNGIEVSAKKSRNGGINKISAGKQKGVTLWVAIGSVDTYDSKEEVSIHELSHGEPATQFHPRTIKTEFMRGPGRCDTSHLSDFNETWSK